VIESTVSLVRSGSGSRTNRRSSVDYSSSYNYEDQNDYNVDESNVNTDDYEQNLLLAERLGSVNVGFSDMQLRRIPTFEYKSTMKFDEENCPICIDPWEVGQQLKRIQCLHCFHARCIDHWLKQKKSCPVCNANLDM